MKTSKMEIRSGDEAGGLKELVSSIADPQKAAAQDLLNGGNNGLSY